MLPSKIPDKYVDVSESHLAGGFPALPQQLQKTARRRDITQQRSLCDAALSATVADVGLQQRRQHDSLARLFPRWRENPERMESARPSVESIAHSGAAIGTDRPLLSRPDVALRKPDRSGERQFIGLAQAMLLAVISKVANPS